MTDRELVVIGKGNWRENLPLGAGAHILVTALRDGVSTIAKYEFLSLAEQLGKGAKTKSPPFSAGAFISS